MWNHIVLPLNLENIARSWAPVKTVHGKLDTYKEGRKMINGDDNDHDPDPCAVEWNTILAVVSSDCSVVGPQISGRKRRGAESSQKIVINLGVSSRGS